ncbi:MAG: polymer-forming cytoskeletal protein [Lachnospiraceae bacterium]|nr:polymer-forming cytoskeletal protein [Lachnospiraceae bacterium]
MNLVENETKFTPADVQKSALLQFDGESKRLAGKNVLEAFEGNDSVIFNETYIIIGEHTKAFKVHAMYDLTIMGDLTAQECVVNGSLTVLGNVRIGRLTCQNKLICKGELVSEKIYVGGDMIADSVVCDELLCDGNVVVQTTANINQSGKIEKTMVAGEGIMGAGRFEAQNAIANEYFEFDGDYAGNILELDMNTVISDTVPPKTAPERIEEIIALANRALSKEYRECAFLGEEQLLERLQFLGNLESTELKTLPIAGALFSRLAEMSYQNRIETVEDYLTVLVAKKRLPHEVFAYESIEHIGEQYLPKARDEMAELMFEPTSVDQFARALSMAIQFEEDLGEDWEDLMNKIFESVGLKYATACSMLRRNKPQKTERTPTEDSSQA